jgi:glycerophosphoryl diester phosphodiesterase
MRLACCLLVVAACGDSLPGPPAEAVLCPVESVSRETVGVFEEDMRYVAHAFGSPAGLAQEEHYTESREAFVASYYNGFRAFEIDLMMLADGSVAAVHDLDETKYGLNRRFTELSRGDLAGRKWEGKYEVLFAEDVVQLMVDHPDIWIILDSKACCHPEIAQVFVDLAPDDSVRDRIVPHVTSDAHAMALPAVYPFPERLYARYQWPGSDAQVKERMDLYGMDNVMMWWDADHHEWSEEVQATMESAGYHVWVHTPIDPAEIESYPNRGIGVYSNGHITCPE